jgi:sugar phosphate isomerase/epimerase
VHPRVSVSQVCTVKWTLEQDLAFYSAEGIKSAGIYLKKLSADIEGGVKKVRAAGLRVSSVPTQPGRLLPEASEKRSVLEMLKPGIDAAAALGGPCYFTAGTTPPRMSTDDAYAALVPLLAPSVSYAKSKGVRLAIEHNSQATRENGFVHTLADAVDLANDTGVEICLEFQNCWMEHHLKRLFKQNVARFVVAQVSDYKIGETLRFNRRVPGDGDMPLEWLLGLLLESGYQGLFELETLGPKIEEEGYAAAVRRGTDWLSERLVRWGA